MAERQLTLDVYVAPSVGGRSSQHVKRPKRSAANSGATKKARRLCVVFSPSEGFRRSQTDLSIGLAAFIKRPQSDSNRRSSQSITTCSICQRLIIRSAGYSEVLSARDAGSTIVQSSRSRRPLINPPVQPLRFSDISCPPERPIALYVADLTESLGGSYKAIQTGSDSQQVGRDSTPR